MAIRTERIIGNSDCASWVAGRSINYIRRRGDPGISVRHISKRNIDLSIFEILCPKRR